MFVMFVARIHTDRSQWWPSRVVLRERPEHPSDLAFGPRVRDLREKTSDAVFATAYVQACGVDEPAKLTRVNR